jgi:hypothetical protein
MAKKPRQASPPASEAEAPNEAAEQGGQVSQISAPIGLARWNPHRPATSEAEGAQDSVGGFAGAAYKPSYEALQNDATGAGVDEWKQADRARAALGETYLKLAADERYAPEFKAEQAWAAYEQTKAKVDKLAPEAREKMLKSASSLERLSIPTPDGESLTTQSTDKLLLTAHERSRIESLIERRTNAAAGPIKPNPAEILQAEYERGLEQGGPGGGATVRAVMDLVRDWGLDTDAVVDAHRKPSHRKAMQNAQEARMRADLIAARVPEPPAPLRKRPRGSSNRASRPQAMLVPKGDDKPIVHGTRKKRRPWAG